MFALRKILMFLSVVRLDAFLPPNQSTNSTLSTNQENSVSYPPKQQIDPTLSPNQKNNVSYPPYGEDNVSYPPNQANNESYPPNQENNVSYPPNQANNVSFPPNQTNKVFSYPPNQANNASFPPNQTNNVSFPPNQENNASFPPNQENNASFPPNQENNASFPPNQENNASFPPNQANNASLPPNQENNASFPPDQENNASFPPNQENNASFPPNQANNASYPPNHTNNASFPPNQENNASFPPNQANNASFPPNQANNASFPPNQENNASFPPNQTNNASFPPNQTNNASYPPNQENNASFPPNQANNASFPPNQENNASFPPNQANNASFPPNQENNASFPPNQTNNSSFPPNQTNNASFPPNQANNASFPPNQANNASFPLNQENNASFPPDQANNESYQPNQNTTTTFTPTQDTLAPMLPDNRVSMLRRVCPGVDICIANASSSKLAPNTILEEDNLVSCCQGCSCHEDCHQTQNCCYEDDATPGIDTHPMDECMYIQTGPPDSSWASRIPAYRIVTAPPSTGCRDPANTHQGPRRSSNTSCGQEYGASWRNFYPVYSREKDTIYKNDNCASCHGATDLVPWLPLLLCDIYDAKSDRAVSLTEQFQFLEQNILSEHCRLYFQYPDRPAVRHKRCYIHYESTCKNGYHPITGNVPYGINLTKEEIVQECETGMTIPVNIKTAVYKNIFCALCNAYSETSLLCDLDGTDISPVRSMTDGFIYILEGNILEERGLTEQSDKTIPLSRACLYNNSQVVLGSCREVYCPSGQLRNADGVCFFPSETWYVSQISIWVKLTYLNQEDMILQMYQEGSVSGQTLIEKLLEASPWRKHWGISEIWHSVQMEDWDYQPAIVLGLQTGIKQSKRVFNDVINALGKHWTTTLDGTKLAFEQSILEYSLSYRRTEAKPAWMWLKGDGYHRNFTLVPSKWTRLDTPLGIMNVPIILKKSFICEQVSLNTGEFDLIENKMVLIIKPKGNVLYNQEFDLVSDKSGDLVPRVCLSDTPFLVRPEVNLSNGGRNTWSWLALIGYIAVNMTLYHI